MKHNNKFSTQRAVTDFGQLIGCILFFTTWIIDSFIIHFSDFLARNVLLLIRIPTGTATILFALVMAYTSYKLVFKKQNLKATLITKGFFQFLRHPIYFAEILIYTGLVFITFSIASLCITAGIFIFLHIIASIEEKQLESLFGKVYTDYKKNTGKWFPKLIKSQ
ncbi:MAG: isoprenylcysteine carboxylmethyltransferase family protein [Spirochaetales bacterium]|nr:isoprenylcysteine carboxylmethyltransferase family protein [Spirochaetales bacterium]